ncbi:MAG TPA: peptidoglycan DD-metalloendopeptidase family protein [Parafilimonas sp.]|nr:peptidoglycan DD-metalloendopeptidase family protein [Parafilimonas sp.]
MAKKLLITFFCFSTFFFASAQQQTKEEIQQKQQQLQKEITELNRTLNQIKSNKKQSLSQLALVQRKIAARNELINSINKDLHRLDNTIYLNQLEINRMKRELDTLKQNYAKSLVFAYRNRSNYDYLNFIFSATTFNDAIKRVAYLKSYRQYRETQVSTIVKTQDVLQQKVAVLTSNKTEKRTTLVEQSKQLNVLQQDKAEQNQVVAQLKGKEKELSKEIKANQKNQQQLKSALQVIINREIAEARKKAEAVAKQKALEEQKKKEAAAANNTTANNPASSNANNAAPKTASNATVKSNRVYSPLESTAEGLTESLNFENNRGRLPWPVSSGVVTIHFGSYQIPGTLLKGNSEGITISLPTGTAVKSVADGEVSAVFDIGGQQAVVVRHGKYFTAYSNLSSIKVSKGSQVNAGSVLGAAGTGGDGDGEVVFMVSNSSGYLNPESWLRSR